MSAKVQSQRKWYLVYFILATFDIFTVSFSLYINHTLSETFSQAVVDNNIWANRKNLYQQLSQLAIDINTPGNRVFESQNVPAERLALRNATKVFETSFQNAMIDANQNIKDNTLRKEFINLLLLSQQPMQAMIEKTENIFKAVKNRQTQLAGEYMSAMDNAYYEFQGYFYQLNRRASEVQQSLLLEQKKANTTIKKAEYAIAVLVLIMVVMVTVYGMNLSRTIRTAEKEKFRQLQIISQANEHHKAVLEAAVDSIASIDYDGMIIDVNPAMEQLFQMSRIDLIGLHLAKLFTEESEDRLSLYLDTHNPNDTQCVLVENLVLTGITKSEEEISVEVSISKTEKQHPNFCIVVMHDLTERVRLDRLKSDFISSVSHELRTPITSICGSLSLIRSGKLGESPKAIQELVEVAERNSQRLSLLINDLLDIQKIDMGAMEIDSHPLSAHEFISEAITQMQPYADSFHVQLRHIETDPNVFIYADKHRLLQVISNLLSNAIKFSPIESTVEVRYIEQEPHVVFEIADQGEGIPEKFRDRIFQRFTQAKSSTHNKSPGTGLGLTITKMLIEKQGGSISFRDNAPQGTVFFFTIPKVVDKTHAENRYA